MPVISIVGAPGVGKSFLTKQLASLNCTAGFFEGEQGVFPAWVLQSVVTGEDPLKRWEYFAQRYRSNLENARKVSDTGELVFVDGALMTLNANLSSEPVEIQSKLHELTQQLSHCTSDIIIFLTASSKYIQHNIEQRNRADEPSEKILTRAIAIQKSFETLCASHAAVIMVQRDTLDFCKQEDLQSVNQLILDKLI